MGTCRRESESRGTRFPVLGARPIREACWRSDSPGTAGLTSGQVRRPRELGQQGRFSQSGAACKQAEAEAVRLANEMQAEYWSVSAKTGEWAQGCRHGDWGWGALLWMGGVAHLCSLVRPPRPLWGTSIPSL